MATGLLVLLALYHGAWGFLPHDSINDKDHLLTDTLLRDVVERMNKELSEAAYAEYPAERLATMSRATKDLENEQMLVDYDALFDGNLHPSLRDQEFMQHSSLWGHQYVSGGAGEGEQRLQPSGALPNYPHVTTDAVLPAYCNPPNPCPVGYTEEQGCLTEFENTAAFSREYQLAQRCMCDGEHMFSCPQTRAEQQLVHFRPDHRSNQLEGENPFLTGERLPIAAKKGFDVNFYEDK